MKRRISIVLALVAASLVLFTLWIHGTLETPPPVIDAGSGEKIPHDESRASSPLAVPAVSEAPSSEDRQVAAAPSAPAAPSVGPAFPFPEEDDAMLIVRCLAKGTRQPLDRIRIRVTRKDNRAFNATIKGEASKGTLRRSAVTAVNGEAQFEVPSGALLNLAAQPEREDLGEAFQEVEPLHTGERRTLELMFVVGDDVHYFGVVLEREGRTPIAGAKVQLRQQAVWTDEEDSAGLRGRKQEPDKITSGDGRFDVVAASRLRPIVRVDAEGFGPRLMPLTTKHSAAENPDAILLDHGASIEATVIDARGSPLSGALVTADAPGYKLREDLGTFDFSGAYPNQIVWSATTAADGRCTLKDVAPRVAMSIAVKSQGKEIYKSGSPITLATGEVRALELRIGGGCAVSGTLVDETGAPVPDHTVWLMRATGDQPRYLLSYEVSRLEVSKVTDSAGKFTFDDVASGRWSIGPAPSADPRGKFDKDALAPYAEIVEVPADVREMQIVVKTQRGLYIRGHVVDSTGKAPARSNVSAYSDTSRTNVSTRGPEGGEFAIGPLMPGAYRLVASGGELDARSEPVSANAGDENVVLTLPAGGCIEGRIVDGANSDGTHAEITYSRTSPAPKSQTFSSAQDDGSFKLRSLAPGTYDLSARVGDGRIGQLRDVVVGAGQRVTDVVLTLEPGAKLRVRYDGAAASSSYEVLLDGARFVGGFVRKGESSVQVVPKGKLAIELRREGIAKKQRREVELAAGEEREVVFNDEP